jgi:hypothetical protein
MRSLQALGKETAAFLRHSARAKCAVFVFFLAAGAIVFSLRAHTPHRAIGILVGAVVAVSALGVFTVELLLLLAVKVVQQERFRTD